MKIFAGLCVIVASILGQIVMYNLTEKYLPQYLQMYVIAIVFTWVGIVASAISE